MLVRARPATEWRRSIDELVGREREVRLLYDSKLTVLRLSLVIDGIQKWKERREGG